ncbi:MAG: ATP-binding cassette domain-containing protein [Intestinibacter bartlettii]|uniref:ATP-binding cassette domain-containing protein n=1 Tax=Intestinibacter bartlettii TaxID=261299 RepID=UPI0039A34106
MFFLNNKLLNNKDRLKNTYLVTQDINSQLFTRSVKEECELNLPEYRLNQVDIVLNRLGLDKYKDKHPMSLSGGQKQRLTIALALLSDKEIIILDEPTSGLDFKNMIIVSEAIKELAKKSNKVVIVVSHDYEFLNTVADGIYEMA